MKNVLHSAWHVTGTKTHQLESRVATLTSILTMTLLKSHYLQAHFAKRKRLLRAISGHGAQSWWQTEYKTGLFWSPESCLFHHIIHCRLFYFSGKLICPLWTGLSPWLLQAVTEKRLWRPWVDTKSPTPTSLEAGSRPSESVTLTIDCVCVLSCSAVSRSFWSYGR